MWDLKKNRQQYGDINEFIAVKKIWEDTLIRFFITPSQNLISRVALLFVGENVETLMRIIFIYSGIAQLLKTVHKAVQGIFKCVLPLESKIILLRNEEKR